MIKCMSRYSFQRLSAFLSQSTFNVFQSSVSAPEQNLAELVWTSSAPDLASHTKIRVQKNGHILIQAASSVWAHKAFHQQQQTKKALLAAGVTVSSIRVSVVHSIVPDVRPDYNRARVRSKVKPLSKNSAKHLDSFADSLSNEALKESLKRLSRRASKQ